MAFTLNGITLPASGYASFNGNNVEEIVCNGVQVWKAAREIQVPNSQILDYLDVTPLSPWDPYDCPQHPGAPVLLAAVWYVPDYNYGEDEKIVVITPKAPYKKIKATFHSTDATGHHESWSGENWEDLDLREIYEWSVNDSGNIHDHYYTVTAESIRLRAFVSADTGDYGHHSTFMKVDMHDVTLYG